jgi:F-box protein 16
MFVTQFDKWSDAQRLAVLEDLINHCKIQQLDQLNSIIAYHKPTFRDDFTHILPRWVSLRIFSFLDPRSLSRCAQVREFCCVYLIYNFYRCIKGFIT